MAKCSSDSKVDLDDFGTCKHHCMEIEKWKKFKDEFEKGKHYTTCMEACAKKQTDQPKSLGCFEDGWKRDLAKYLCGDCTFEDCAKKAKEASLIYIGL